MFCPKCGNQLPDGSAFCGKCGAKLGTSKGVTPAVGVAGSAPSTPTAPNAASSRSAASAVASTKISPLAMAAAVLAAVAVVLSLLPWLEVDPMVSAASGWYLSSVAFPPRRCRCALLVSSTLRTSSASVASMPGRRSVASLCTLDLLTPNFCAAVRTVQPVSAIYAPIFFDLSLIYSCIKSPPGRVFHVFGL